MSREPSADQSDYRAMRSRWREGLLAPLWEGTAHRPSPKPQEGHHWRWQDVSRFAHEAAGLTSPEVVERRVLRLVNPDAKSDSDESTVGNLAAAIQILLPGETARPHRHSINALRFVLEGEGATTIVNGKQVPMHAGDMVLTPGHCWHEHFHTGAGPVIWLDALDAPLHNAIGTVTFQGGPVVDSHPTLPDAAFQSPNVLPVELGERQSYSPVFSYPYQDVLRALDHAPVGDSGMRSVRYVNPLTGGATMPSIDCGMTALEPGKPTREYRSNASTVCLFVDGEGESWVGDSHFRWSRYDIVTIPPNNWVRHKAHAPSHMFQITDREMLVRLGLLQESYRD